MKILMKSAGAALVYALLTLGADAAFWSCEFPAGTYTVNLQAIASVSVHEYVVDGAARVTELTVATNSAVVARFYYMEPLVTQTPAGVGQALIEKAQGRLSDLAKRTDTEEIWKKVTKNYPATTHAHTVEYRLASLAQIKQLQKSLEEAWRYNRETQIKMAAIGDSDGQ